MTYKEIRPQVIREIEYLKTNCTVLELAKLDISRLDGQNERYCIYGLMTGDCDSYRALELLNNFPNKVLFDSYFGLENRFVYGDEKLGVHGRYYTPLEVWICDVSEDNENIVAYLKGETEELKLSHA